jgi:hypothetical protein
MGLSSWVLLHTYIRMARAIATPDLYYDEGGSRTRIDSSTLVVATRDL